MPFIYRQCRIIFETNLNVCCLLYQFVENEIDKEALLELTERALELLVPVIGHRMKFLSKLKKLQEESERVSEVLSNHQPNVVVCSPGTKNDSRTNKFSTPAGQSKIRYCSNCSYKFIYYRLKVTIVWLSDYFDMIGLLFLCSFVGYT